MGYEGCTSYATSLRVQARARFQITLTQATGRSGGGRTTKVPALTDRFCRPLAGRAHPNSRSLWKWRGQMIKPTVTGAFAAIASSEMFEESIKVAMATWRSAGSNSACLNEAEAGRDRPIRGRA